MATLDITRWANEERESSLSDLFGRRERGTNVWHLQNLWLRTTASTPEKDETIIRHDEITLKRVSVTSGRVKIAFTDEMAEQVKRIVGGQ